MQISFFEEFPITRNLAKLNYVNFPIKLYLATKNITEFKKIRSALKDKNITEMVYWPLLKRKEGYWISPFAERKALLRAFKELRKEKLPVMLDLELPTRHNPLLYLTQLAKFFRNKRTIKNFIGNYHGRIYLGEYFPEGRRYNKILSSLGVHYQSRKARIIKMLYHSLHHFNQKFLKKEMKKAKKDFGPRYLVALGTIATGIKGNETILPPKLLAEDLQTAKEAGVKEVIIFRLGGLNQKYAQILRKFSS